MKNSIKRLQAAIQIPTCSHPEAKDTNWLYFDEFIKYLENYYPIIHQNLEKTIVNNYGLIFHWRGQSNKSNASLPILLTAHYDVVAASEEGWQHPPFSGYDDGEYIWGRGTLDDKSSLICILEAIEQLLSENYIPPYDIYFAFGFDEEQGGNLGAQKIADYFLEKQIHFQYVLDEGGAIVGGKTLGVKPDLAVVGIAEKGNNSFRLTFKGEEGHSSTPPNHTAIGKMAAFIQQVENHPMPVHLTETVIEMLKALSEQMSGIQKFALTYPKTFFPIVKKILLKNKQTAAMLRTTFAFTMTNSGSGHNVLPKEATCVVNARILQGDSVQSIKDYFNHFGFDYKIESILENEPTAISDVHSNAMSYLADRIQTTFNGTIALPYLMVGGTDSRYYEKVTDQTFRFLPCRLTNDELATMHATNERISHENLEKMILFYKEFLINLA